jgi:hypothetical protein
MRTACLLSLLTLAPVLTALRAQSAGDTWEILYDGQTKILLQDARFTAGTRHLSWLVAADKSGKSKTKNLGPEYLEFREEKSTTFKDGIVTLIPVTSLLRLEYEPDKKLVRAVVKQPGDKDLTLVGSTKFTGINKFTLDGTAAKAEVGVAGALQFKDGFMTVPIRGFAQSGAKPVEMPTGDKSVIVTQDKEKTEHAVSGLMPLYRVGAGQKLASVLMFQKVGQIDVTKLAVLRQLPPADKKQTISHEYEVTQAGGEKQRLTLLEKTQLDDNQPAVLIGLVGRVAAGFKLFPPHTITEVRFEGMSE